MRQTQGVPRSKTTQIPRPSRRRGSDDVRRSRLGDFTRPIPIDKKISRRPRVALVAGLGALAVIATLAAIVLVLPHGTWRDQDDKLRQREAQLEELQRVNGELQAEVDRLQTADGVREAAREEVGFVEEGEERTSVMPFPDLPTALPDGWPYSGVTAIIEARRAGPAPTPTD